MGKRMMATKFLLRLHRLRRHPPLSQLHHQRPCLRRQIHHHLCLLKNIEAYLFKNVQSFIPTRCTGCFIKTVKSKKKKKKKKKKYKKKKKKKKKYTSLIT